MSKQTIVIRANEIRDAAIADGKRITDRDIAARILDTLPQLAREEALSAVTKMVRGIGSNPVHPPEQQGVLFANPDWVRITNSDGDEEFVPGDLLTGTETLQMLDRKLRHDAGQVYRGRSAVKDVRAVMAWGQYDDTIPYNANRVLSMAVESAGVADGGELDG